MSLVRVTARRNLEVEGPACGPTDSTYGPITGLRDLLSYVRPLLTRGRLSRSMIICHLIEGPMIRTFACAVSNAAPPGPAVPSALVVE